MTLLKTLTTLTIERKNYNLIPLQEKHMVSIVAVEDILRINRKMSLDSFIDRVKPIIEAVKNRGDEALIEFTEKFDKVKLKSIKVSDDEIDEAYELVDDDLVDALELAKRNIEKFHSITSPQDLFVDFDFYVLGKKYVPLESVGLYVPGGRASYPSTALMAGIPASIAGVERIVVCTPPSGNGRVNPLTLVACDLAGVHEIYRVGGAQAIAAMAYGTETIKPVLKIAGPGNVYVTAAKILVSKDVAVDMPAGPSEILVIADESADVELIALDCLAQLEHDPMAVAVLLTTSEKLAREVANLVKKFADEQNVDNLKIAVVSSIDEALEISNKFAPEHLELVFDGAEKAINKVKNAGSVFLGEWSGVAFGDYASGTNHILPTAGYARMYSGLSVETFMKSITFQQLREDGVKMLGDSVVRIAKAEGLSYHAISIKRRLERLEK